ncbi:uncharacterized protein LOC108606147 isoform X2 [Drosophila busckii]|uniref:uncharacterized protein LOC108606147 isoform X2 n=1 Tax=Drosophila busckii TaxID=30019 RepID=UPI00083EF002|nr:uncharacterized protein LOC108606147 isoform X2 [Drosophila busckii]
MDAGNESSHALSAEYDGEQVDAVAASGLLPCDRTWIEYNVVSFQELEAQCGYKFEDIQTQPVELDTNPGRGTTLLDLENAAILASMEEQLPSSDGYTNCGNHMINFKTPGGPRRTYRLREKDGEFYYHLVEKQEAAAATATTATPAEFVQAQQTVELSNLQPYEIYNAFIQAADTRNK